MSLHLFSITHRTAPIRVREVLVLDQDHRRGLLTGLIGVVDEAAAIMTCNRSELYVVTPNPETASAALLALADRAGLPGESVSQYARHFEGREAARHLFRVSAGLDSIVLGEPQILGQVRQAIDEAREHGAAGTTLDKLFNLAVVSGKRARSETAISQGAGSVSHAAVALARATLGRLAGRRALVIGLGEMGRLVARNLASHGVSELLICNRTSARADLIARELGGKVVSWGQLETALTEVDIVVSATGARRPVLTRARLKPVVERRDGRSLLLIDIAVPRDIDPDVVGLPGVHLRDIDALNSLREDNLRGRAELIPHVEAIVDQQVELFDAWLRSRAVGSTIRALRDWVDGIREQEVDKALRRLQHLDERDRQVVLALSHGIANKLLHPPVTHLRTTDDQERYSRALADLFGIDPEPSPAGRAVHAPSVTIEA